MSQYFTLLLVLFAFPVNAHNVIGGVYAIGSTIEGEAGFSNGDMAAQGTPVIVTDKDGNILLELATDSEGFFSMQAQSRIDHLFKMEMGSGHVLKLLLPAAELPESLAGAVSSTTPAKNKKTANLAQTALYDQAELKGMIEKAVAKQVKPLRKELRAFQEKAGFQDMIGGIGYIFGLCGIGIWWRQRKLSKTANA